MNVIDVPRKINFIPDLCSHYRRYQMPRSRLAWRLAKIGAVGFSKKPVYRRRIGTSVPFFFSRSLGFCFFSFDSTYRALIETGSQHHVQPSRLPVFLQIPSQTSII
ncbi:MAG: hypothetical protein IPN81_07585 [Nitrosomonadales bacterium]|nr:hypothetical protein [Nitrosomonadales bacterium]